MILFTSTTNYPIPDFCSYQVAYAKVEKKNGCKLMVVWLHQKILYFPYKPMLFLKKNLRVTSFLNSCLTLLGRL